MMITKIDNLLKETMTDSSFKLWMAIKDRIPDVWERKASSTGKYHRRKNGTVPTIAEHTYEMLVTAIKLLPIFRLELKTLETDVLLLSIVLHDSLKYNTSGTTLHTTTEHDRIIADTIKENKKVFMNIFSEQQVDLLEQCVRFHSGRWSSDWSTDTSFDKLPKEVFFIHVLDMLSTYDLLNVGDEK